MASTPSPRRSKQLPLVWVTQGKTQHLAYLIEKEQQDGEALIRWQSTGKIDRVFLKDVALDLPPRRRSRAEAFQTPQRREDVLKVPLNNDDYESEVLAEDGDDEVEVLLTINPPSPKKQKPVNESNVGHTITGFSDGVNIKSNTVTPREKMQKGSNRDLLDSGLQGKGGDNNGFADDDDDDDSLSTQEDIVLANLALKGDACRVEGIEDTCQRDSFCSSIDCITVVKDAQQTTSPGNSSTAYCDQSNVERPSTVSPVPIIANFGQKAFLDVGSYPEIQRCDPTVEVRNSLLPVNCTVSESLTFSTPPKSLRDNSMSAISTERDDTLIDGSTQAWKPSFTYKSSAYVQNLAEICHTIMGDVRWRIGSEPLFTWEHGDDLSAMIRLDQMYQPDSPKCIRPRHSCSCIVCHDSESREDLEEGTTASTKDNDDNKHEQSEDGDDEDSRAMNLYCRLYYRKGPWFRIDDIFIRYYAPKKQFYTKNSQELSQEPTEVAAVSSSSQYFDEQKLDEAIGKMNLLLEDLNRLCKQGLIRTFNNEEECGKMAGSVSPEGSGVLLNADERRSVLERLGGSKKKWSGYRQPREERKSVSPRENEIWKQMYQQQSIAAGMLLKEGNSNSRHLLPVRHHVNHEVVAKLANAVVMSASRVDYVPAPILRAKLILVKKSLSAATQQRGTQSLYFAKLDTCYRLREAPLRTLRRCCRLYLCATSGPGDMRGDGTNGWKSLRDCLGGNSSLPMTRFLPQPGDNTWNNTTYPGLSSRFGLSHFGFTECYSELPASTTTCTSDEIQVFSDSASFRLWELAVEIRANVDYLIQLNDLILYDERKKSREVDQNETNHSLQGRERTSYLLSDSEQTDVASKLHVDFLQLLDTSARETIVNQFCNYICKPDTGSKEVKDKMVDAIEECLERAFGFQPGNDDNTDDNIECPFFRTDCQKVIFVIGVVTTNLLQFAYQNMSEEERTRKSRRCWLRHLWWEGVMAYVLWDCIPILEKLGMYRQASRGLEVLVFGSFQPDSWRPKNEEEGNISAGWGEYIQSMSVGDIMISRRARGKAIERLMIDYIHMLRKEMKHQQAKQKETQKKLRSNSCIATAADCVNRLCDRILSVASSSGFITFAAIRALARRTKRPLDQVVEDGGGREAKELGFRLRNNSMEKSTTIKGYVDWTPTTDQAVAAALTGTQNGAGSRCTYIGFEDKSESAQISSLNVEELAMEYYATGRLPANDKQLGGGSWVGWHDEGGHLRTLFRILCACPVLGMDGGCGRSDKSHSSEHLTVHLTKYQGAPFDLHVGSWSHVTQDGKAGQTVSGFYNRRKASIDLFLAKLETLSSQDIADCVHEAIQARTKEKSRAPNMVLHRDIQQLRTLSMLAAGFGGKSLSAAFRCMLFDYRHFSGGLPDLLLTRALYADTKGDTKEFVDIGEWIGEEFSEEAKTAREAETRSNFLSDKDDEFLGCSKLGDSGGSRSNNRYGRQSTERREPPASLPEVPPKLVMRYKNRPVIVQCLFVEVKSQNDRLDGRQEDWLNVLDRVGDARVCKFVSNKKPQKKRKDIKD